jgi:hypothetical protein
MGAARSYWFCLSIVCYLTLTQLIAERDRLNKDLELAHSAIKQLEAELENLQVGYGRGSGRR